MSRRRTSSSRMLTDFNDEQKNDQDMYDLDDDDEDESPEQPSQQASVILEQLTSWRERLSPWFNLSDFGRTLVDDKVYESNKILPSIISFIFGLLIVKIYGESFDSAFTYSYKYLKGAHNVVNSLITKLNTKDFEIIAALGVLALFWIGALRMLFNFARQLFQLPRFN